MDTPGLRFALIGSLVLVSVAGLFGAQAQQPATSPAAPPSRPAVPGARSVPQPAPTQTPATGGDATTNAGKVLALVDGVAITQRDLDIAAEDMADRLPRVPEGQKRDYLLSYLIDLTIGARAAQQAKVDQSPDFARKLAYARNKLLLDEYLADAAAKAATPAAARATYEQTIRDLKPQEEVRARHILVDSEDLAKKAYARLKAGEDFRKVATELSKDPGSAKDGGELGWFTKDRMVPAFADAAFKLKPGEMSEPVKTQFGWHVIVVEERRTKPAPSFDDVKDEVEAYVTRKAQQDLILSLRANANIERLDGPAKDTQGKDGSPRAVTGDGGTPEPLRAPPRP